MRRRRLELDVSYAARRPWVPSARKLARWAQAALERQAAARESQARDGGGPQVSQAALSVRVVGQARSRSLNEKYRRKARPTNVLSFEGAGPMPDGHWQLGELVICAPVVAREARSQGKTLEAHWAHLTVHGVLHLLGYDHESARDAAGMEAAEIQILDRLGFSDPYR